MLNLTTVDLPALPGERWPTSLCWQTGQHLPLPANCEFKNSQSTVMCACVCSIASAHHTHLLVHGWKVPDITDEGPAGHHPQQVTDHAVLGTVPESISKLWVILGKDTKIHRSAVRNRIVKCVSQ